MSITVRRDEKRHLLVATALGDLTTEGLLTFIQQEWNAAPNGYAVLFDATGARVGFCGDDVRALAAETRKGGAMTAPLAIVVTADHAFGLARMYQLLAYGDRCACVQVFRSIG